ncbi:MAG: tripartite tricarboxylate transporter substrate binding protein [Proteobacteria bacterium]|nr:tripartite tricarboxylate transporter substrate binding protein [Pseudomonadota bacterium]
MITYRYLIVAALATTVGVAAAHLSHAQQKYPSKPIRMLVPFSAGSGTDQLARMVGQRFTETWGQQVVVDNRASGGGVVAGQALVTSSPDGYTLMMVSAGHAASATLYAKLPYDVSKDFAGVSQVASAPNVLIASKDLGVKSLTELIALAKAKPGFVNIGSSGIGSGAHINAEMFKLEGGINIVHVPYKGAPEAVSDIIGGRTHLFFANPLNAAPFIKDGRVLALAVSTRQRTPILPNVPTIAEAGIPGFEFDQWFGLLAPAKTPRAIVKQLSDEVARALALPEVKERMVSMGNTPAASTPEAFDEFIRSEIEKLGKVIKAAGVQVN